MPDARLAKTRDAYYLHETVAGCVCALLFRDGSSIPIGQVARCPVHPTRLFRRGPSGED